MQANTHAHSVPSDLQKECETQNNGKAYQNSSGYVNAGYSHHNIMKAIRAPTSCGFHRPTASACFVLEFCLCPMQVIASREICKGVTLGLQSRNSRNFRAEPFQVLVKTGLAKWERRKIHKGYTAGDRQSDMPLPYIFAVINFHMCKLRDSAAS